jgi:outer membrane protein TolC
MKMMKKRAFKIMYPVTMALLLTLPMRGGQMHDSLRVYLEAAAVNNPSIRQKHYEYEAALTKISQAGSLPDPELTAGVLIKPMEVIGGMQIADLRLMQMFPWFGVLKSAKDETNQMANAKMELLRDKKLEVFFEVQSTWYELYSVRRALEISGKNLEILGTIERLALARFKSAPAKDDTQMPGLADLYRIQMEAGELRNSIARLNDRSQTVMARFNSYLNRQPETNVYTPDSLAIDSLPVPLTTAIDSILKNNPGLTMLESEIQSLDARKKKIRGMGYPSIGLGLDYSIIGIKDMPASGMNGKDMIMPMVSVTLPVYRKKYRAMVSEAELLKDASTEQYNATANTLVNEFYTAIRQYKDAQRRVKLYSEQYLLASKSLEIIRRSFAESAASLTDLLRVRQQTYDYELKKDEAIADLGTSTALLQKLMALSMTDKPR